jgi:hypothetical protein
MYQEARLEVNTLMVSLLQLSTKGLILNIYIYIYILLGGVIKPKFSIS